MGEFCRMESAAGFACGPATGALGGPRRFCRNAGENRIAAINLRLGPGQRLRVVGQHQINHAAVALDAVGLVLHL